MNACFKTNHVLIIVQTTWEVTNVVVNQVIY